MYTFACATNRTYVHIVASNTVPRHFGAEAKIIYKIGQWIIDCMDTNSISISLSRSDSFRLMMKPPIIATINLDTRITASSCL